MCQNEADKLEDKETLRIWVIYDILANENHWAYQEQVKHKFVQWQDVTFQYMP